jgi:Zn-dependent M28 family amino/carboxypeptidase
MLGIRTPIDVERVPWPRMTLNAGRPGMDFVHPDGRVESGPTEIRFQALVGEAAAERMLAGSKVPLAAMREGATTPGYPRGETGIALRVRSRTSASRASSPNVVAVLPGADPALAGEHVVVTAHLDHVGIGAEVEGDDLYNGFYDNALGSAIVIEAARALAAAPARPRRSIVFLLVTGEEKGLLGSEYYSLYPTVPVASLVANVNIDMPLLLTPSADLVSLGADHSSLGPLAAAAASAHDFEISPDPHPEEVYFIRSDQYSFVRRGVPAINLVPGAKAVGGGDEKEKASEQFLRRCYHRPCDEVELGADWESVGRYAAVNARLVADVANLDARPSWNPGDFFGVTFAGGR